MWEKIDVKFFQAYMPPEDYKHKTLISDVCKMFSLKAIRNNTSGVMLEDNTQLISYQIYDVLMNLWDAMTAGKRIDEVWYDREMPPNWREVVPSIFKNMAGTGIESGQAKIFYSVVTAVASVEDGQDLHLAVPGAGSIEYGWSYTAVAMILTDRGCKGRIDLYDPIAEPGERTVGNFLLTYFKRVVPREFESSVTHVLDDTFPSAIAFRTLERLVSKGVIVSTKTNVQLAESRLNTEALIHKLPGQLFNQPFYKGSERRMVYNFKPRYVTRRQHQCNCFDCLKMAESLLVEEEWHHVIGFGVRPCFPVKGRTLINQAYGYYTGRKTELDMVKEPLETLPKLTKYVKTLQRYAMERVNSLVERKKGKKTEYFAMTNFSMTQEINVKEIKLPCIVDSDVPLSMIRLAFEAKVIKTPQCYYVSESDSSMVVEQAYTGRFDVELTDEPRMKAVVFVYSVHTPLQLFINQVERKFRLITQYTDRRVAHQMYSGRNVYEAEPKISDKVWILKIGGYDTKKEKRKMRQVQNIQTIVPQSPVSKVKKKN
jgi:hypothetical protein